mmetsp:Transcript_21537/g.46696  ORF Transcript_21537/g.46696 Transcript_21537/m.46696 type:complete len:140 (+) Transcript_21537:48-467(+)
MEPPAETDQEVTSSRPLSVGDATDGQDAPGVLMAEGVPPSSSNRMSSVQNSVMDFDSTPRTDDEPQINIIVEEEGETQEEEGETTPAVKEEEEDKENTAVAEGEGSRSDPFRSRASRTTIGTQRTSKDRDPLASSFLRG